MSTTLITGGSSGIGMETARLLAGDGHHLLIVSLLEEELAFAKKSLQEEFPKVVIDTLQQDLSQPQSARQVYEWAGRKSTAIDFLINNAGFGTYGFVDEIDLERETNMINLHIGTLYRLSRLFLQDMMERDSGRIINLSSISAFQPNPRMATYGATKAFVLHFSRAVNEELRERKSQVRVVAVCPPPVRNTGFEEAAAMQQSRLFNSWLVTTPDVVARAIRRSLSSRRDMVIPGRGLDWVYSLTKRLPDPWQIRLSAAHLKIR